MLTSAKNSRLRPYLTTFNLVISSIIVVAIGGGVAFWYWQEQLTTFFGEDIFRLNYQFLLLVVIGGVGTFFLSEYSKHKEAQREKWAKEQDLQREFYEGLFKAYNTAKKVRRVLRAKAHLRDEKKIAMAPYNELMGQLIDSQLQFELLKKLAPIVFYKVDDSIDEYVSVRCALETIEKYLNHIVDEYEHKYEDAESKSISELKWLEGFIGKSGNDSLFKTEFTTPVHAVRDKVVELLNERVGVDSRNCPKRIIVYR
jgi:hypothetical protein